MGRRTQEHEGGEAVPLYPFSGTQAPNIKPGPGGLCLRNLLPHMGTENCRTWLTAWVKDHTEPRRMGDGNTAHAGYGFLRAAAGGFPRSGQDSVWLGQPAPSAASKLPVWLFMTAAREVVATPGQLVWAVAFFHCLPPFPGCDHQRNLHPHLVNWSQAKEPSLFPPLCFAVKRWRRHNECLKWWNECWPRQVTVFYSQP